MMTKIVAFAMILTVAVVGCKKSEDSTPAPVVPPPDPLKSTYILKTKDVLGVTGTVTIAEQSSGSSSSIVTIVLTGAPMGTHPAHIHGNSVIETGPVVYPLNAVDATGKSTTTLSVSYSTLVNFDGYVNVHQDALTLGTIIAQGDIGGNLLTGNNRTYTLLQDSTSGISGSALFEKRLNGTTLVTIDLSSGGSLPPGLYPSQVNLGSVSTIGTPVRTKTLNPVDGATRIGKTNLRKLNDGSVITYDNWLVYDGFITVYDVADTTNVIAKGNIGSH